MKKHLCKLHQDRIDYETLCRLAGIYGMSESVDRYWHFRELKKNLKPNEGTSSITEKPEFDLPEAAVYQLQTIALADDEMVKREGAAEKYRFIARHILELFEKKDATPLSQEPDNSKVNESADDVVKFLCGEEPFMGLWFHDEVPIGMPRYWWRRHLREYAQSERQKARKDAIQECQNKLKEYDIEGIFYLIEQLEKLKNS